MANEAVTYSNLLDQERSQALVDQAMHNWDAALARDALTVEAIEKATREMEQIAADIRHLDAEINRLTSANSVPRFFTKQTNPSQAHVSGPRTRWIADFFRETLPTPTVDPSRYPHTCPRCFGPAYVGAVEVDCAGGCK